MKKFEAAARTMAGECPAMRLRQTSRILSSLYDAELRPLGIQLSQLPVLSAAAMVGERGIALGALARALVMDATTLTRKVRPLEKAGLLRSMSDPADARAKLILLTPRGERMLEAAFPLWQRARARAEAAFGEAKLAALRAQLEPIVQAAGGFTGMERPGASARSRASKARGTPPE